MTSKEQGLQDQRLVGKRAILRSPRGNKVLAEGRIRAVNRINGVALVLVEGHDKFELLDQAEVLK